ncbi:hypothetical protein Csa_020160 [Cucumis sativus]|uniref:Transmembrane protein n=1 Tax=Cucumis sativus TaxID=3659 RepID=A0A0A0K4L6_CUCSA|nr:hypothetical protein Csa_020160 [Cucumis sativus]
MHSTHAPIPLPLHPFKQTNPQNSNSMTSYRNRTTADSILDSLSLNPPPYPVLLLLAVVSIFLGASWWLSYESAVEAAEDHINWILFATPVLLILLVRFLSSLDPTFFSSSPWDRRRRTHHIPAEGTSPWGVAAFILLLLVLLQFQSSFRESWSI